MKMMTKCILYDKIILKEDEKIFIDPVYKIIDKASEIIDISNKNYNFTKSFNFNKKNIHSILYESQDFIEISNPNIEDISSFYFYLALLIEENLLIINYIYNLDLIKTIQNKNVNNNNYLYNIIKHKIIKILLNNYYGFEVTEEDNLKEARKIEENNSQLLDNNVRFLEENNINLNKNDISEENLENLFVKTIISLMKSDKFSDFDYMSEVVSSLDLENIDLTRDMFEAIEKEFNNNNGYYLQKYEILDLNDLSNTNKINFHYLILKYIFKSSFYIYNIPFFMQIRKNIIKLIKSNDLIFENLDEKTKYVIQQYLDSPYYYNHYYIEKKENIITEEKAKNSQKQNNLFDGNAINNYQKSTGLENSSKITEKEIKSQNENDNLKEEKNIQRQILAYSTITLHTNERGNEPFIILDKITFGKQNIDITNFFLKMKKEKISDINFQKFLEFWEKFKEKIKNEFINNYCLRLKLQFQNEYEKSNSLFNNKDFNITCKYYFYSPIDNSEMTFKTENILVSNSTESEGFIYFLEEINNENYKDEKYEYNESDYIDLDFKNKKVNSKSLTSKKSDTNISIYNPKSFIKKDISTDNNNKSTTLMCTKADANINATKEEIIAYIGIINKHNKSAKYCGELSDGFHLSFGGENSIFIYNKDFELKAEIKNLDDSIYNVCEKKSKKSNSIEIIACCNKNLNLIILNKTNFKYNVKQYQIPDIICLFCCEMNDNNYIISGESIVVGFKDLFETTRMSKSHKFHKKTYRSGTNINNKIAALTSNSLIKNGEDGLLICNLETQKIEKKIMGFSHIYDSNGLASMDIGNKTILLSACKKYFKNQKNGILLVDNVLEKEDKIKETFYPTENFEVNCICPLYDIQKNDNNSDNSNETQKKPTNFFLAGGFDSDKGIGIIQLYQVSNNEGDISSIEYLQDIEYDNNSEFQGFEMTVTCIKQSEINGNIIISCIDGNIYLFSKPNLEFYLQESYF